MIKAVQQFQLGTVMGTEQQALRVMEQMKTAGYDGIELCSFMVHPAGPAVRLLTAAAGMPVGRGGGLPWPELVRASALKVVAIHQDLGTLEKDPEDAIEEARRFGTENVVITGMYRYDYGSRAALAALSDRLNRAGARLAGAGLRLHYHNHNAEFLRVEGDLGLTHIMKDTDPSLVSFEFDSYWAADAGVNAAAVMESLSDRLRLWHINDRGCRLKGPAMTPILKQDCMELGSGAMDLCTLAAIAKAAPVEAVILETQRNWINRSPVESFQISSRWLQENL